MRSISQRYWSGGALVFVLSSLSALPIGPCLDVDTVAGLRLDIISLPSYLL